MLCFLCYLDTLFRLCPYVLYLLYLWLECRHLMPWINIWVTYFQLILLLLCQALANILQLTINMEEVILFQMSTLYLNQSKSVTQNRGNKSSNIIIWRFVCKIFGRYMPTLWLISAGLWPDKRIWWECLLLKLLCRIYLLIWWTRYK